jgi:hypothetical protein
MDVGKSVSKAINEVAAGDFESAMLHACNAVDGTAKKALPSIVGSNLRFTSLLRDNYLMLGVMGMPGINLVDTRFPVAVNRPKAPGGAPDLADVIYGVHRCTHGHGEELPAGFEFRRDSSGLAERTSIVIERGRIQLSDRIIFGLLAVAVFAPENVGQNTPEGYYLSLGAHQTFIINDWWGRRTEFEVIASQLQLPHVTLDFGDWMNSP